jgi:hypothetical protein
MSQIPLEKQINIDIIASELSNCSCGSACVLLEATQDGKEWRAFCCRCKKTGEWKSRPEYVLINWNNQCSFLEKVKGF